MKVLFVENHPEFARTVAAAFLGGHELTVVPTISAARKEINRGDYDVALVDYDLDDGKGADLVSWIRSSGTAIRVLAISAKDEGNAELLKAGADAVCRKTDFRQISSLLAEKKP